MGEGSIHRVRTRKNSSAEKAHMIFISPKGDGEDECCPETEGRQHRVSRVFIDTRAGTDHPHLRVRQGIKILPDTNLTGDTLLKKLRKGLPCGTPVKGQVFRYTNATVVKLY